MYTEIERPQRNFVTGRFLPGCTPHNKGKAWTEWMSEESAERSLAGLKLGRKRPGDPHPCAGKNKRKVVYVDELGIPHSFESATKAGKVLGLERRNITACCLGTRHSVGGIRFYYFDSNEWIKEVSR